MAILKYPKMIQRKTEGDEVELMTVKDAYEHAEMVKEGWSGPPEWESALPDLRLQIEETKRNLQVMEERLIYMEQFEKDREAVIDQKQVDEMNRIDDAENPAQVQVLKPTLAKQSLAKKDK